MTATPPLDAGLVFVDGDVGALHRLVLDADQATGEGADGPAESERIADGEARADGGATAGNETLWIDAGGAASTYALTARDGSRALRGIRVARAFTAHQHHQLVREAVAAASERTGLVLAPNVATLYAAADAPSTEIDRLFAAAVELLAELGATLDVPVLVSAPEAGDERRATLRDRATQEVDCRRTDLGYHFATEEFETTTYWQRGWWQTTVPYWVELFGAVETEERAFEPTALRAVAD